MKSIDLREAVLHRHWLVLLRRSFMFSINLRAILRRGDANAFDEGKASGQEATLGIFVMKPVMPTRRVPNIAISSLLSQPLREFIAPCVHVGASAAATMEVEHVRAAASLVHVMTIPRVQDVS